MVSCVRICAPYTLISFVTRNKIIQPDLDLVHYIEVGTNGQKGLDMALSCSALSYKVIQFCNSKEAVKMVDLYTQ